MFPLFQEAVCNDDRGKVIHRVVYDTFFGTFHSLNSLMGLKKTHELSARMVQYFQEHRSFIGTDIQAVRAIPKDDIIQALSFAEVCSSNHGAFLSKFTTVSTSPDTSPLAKRPKSEVGRGRAGGSVSVLRSPSSPGGPTSSGAGSGRLRKKKTWRAPFSTDEHDVLKTIIRDEFIVHRGDKELFLIRRKNSKLYVEISDQIFDQCDSSLRSVEFIRTHLKNGCQLCPQWMHEFCSMQEPKWTVWVEEYPPELPELPAAPPAQTPPSRSSPANVAPPSRSSPANVAVKINKSVRK